MSRSFSYICVLPPCTACSWRGGSASFLCFSLLRVHTSFGLSTGKDHFEIPHFLFLRVDHKPFWSSTLFIPEGWRLQHQEFLKEKELPIKTYQQKSEANIAQVWARRVRIGASDFFWQCWLSCVRATEPRSFGNPPLEKKCGFHHHQNKQDFKKKPNGVQQHLPKIS